MITTEQKAWIDNATYEELLRKWRFTPISSNTSYFTGEAGSYYSLVMAKKRSEHPDPSAVSKLVGWA